MIQDPNEINKIIQQNKYNIKPISGRPKGMTKDKTKLDPNKKLGRPTIINYDIFDPKKRSLTKKFQSYQGQHINRIIRYEIDHNDIKYLFSTLKQVEKEFNLTTHIVLRLLETNMKRNNNIELSYSDKLILDTYPNFKCFVKLPLDKTKKIVDIVRIKIT